MQKDFSKIARDNHRRMLLQTFGIATKRDVCIAILALALLCSSIILVAWFLLYAS